MPKTFFSLMPKKSHQKKILTMHSFLSLGMGVIGIFWPFLLGAKFGMSSDEIIMMMALFWIFTALWAWPCVKGAELLGDKKKIISFWILLLIVSYSLVLGIENFHNYYYLALLLFFYSSHLMLYWPLFHQATAQSTQNQGIGAFLAHFQTITIIGGVLGPLITGYFLDQNDIKWLIIGGNILLLLSLCVSSRLETNHFKISPFPKFWKMVKSYPHKHYFPGVLISGVQHMALSLLWIMQIQTVADSFISIGFIIALAVLVEVMAAQLWGKFIDRFSAKKLITYALWARFIDISSRGLLLFFPFTIVAMGLQMVGALLGPIFQNTIGGRHYDNALKSGHIADFLIAYEFYLCLSRGMTLFLAYGAFQIWGTSSLAIFLFGAGVLSFGLKRY